MAYHRRPDRGSDAWQVSVYLGHDPSTGKAIRKTVLVRGSERIARQTEDQLKAWRALGRLSPTRLTVDELLHGWLDDRRPPATQASTWYGYSRHVEAYLVPQFRAVRLANLTALHVDQLVQNLRARRLNETTIGKIVGTLRRALKWAQRRGMIHNNPAEAVTVGRGPRPPRRALAPDDAQAMIGAFAELNTVAGNAAVVALLTGLRRSEVLGLRWADVHFDADELLVDQKTVQVPGFGMITDRPKSEASRRLVPLVPAAVEALRRQRVLQLEQRLVAKSWLDEDRVFANPPFGRKPAGGPLPPRAFDDAYKKTRDVAKLPPVKFHELRHTFATYLLTAGIQPKVVQELMGHSSIVVTLDIYGHVLKGEHRKALDELAGWMSRQADVDKAAD